MTSLLLIAAATFVSEDLTCIGTGALIAAGKLGFLPGVLACLLGIFAGDLLLYLAGRLAGARLRGEKFQRASAWLNQRGPLVVLISRFTPGLRLPTYVAAGFLKTRFWTFAGYFILAAAVWTPLLVGGAALLGERGVRTGLLGATLLIAAWQVRRIPRWEFWPAWLAYLPVAPYFLYLVAKHRSLRVFTAANPGIFSGGLAGESKSLILSRLPNVPDFRLIPASHAPHTRLAAAFDFVSSWPVVLKPDVGQRGDGVKIARTPQDIDEYLAAATRDTIVQNYVDGPEFGIFYYRYPGQDRGRIFSITEKLFPSVTGDGRRTVRELILADERAAHLADVYLSRLSPAEVPAAGRRVPLAEIGSHCRGAVFRNGAHLETEVLRDAVDAVAKRHPGFYIGRFDVRAASLEDLRAGRFHVLELNGVSAEPTHIYDPSVSVWDAYRAMFAQWRMAFEIGAVNVRHGARPTLYAELWGALFPTAASARTAPPAIGNTAALATPPPARTRR